MRRKRRGGAALAERTKKETKNARLRALQSKAKVPARDLLPSSILLEQGM